MVWSRDRLNNASCRDIRFLTGDLRPPTWGEGMPCQTRLQVNSTEFRFGIPRPVHRSSFHSLLELTSHKGLILCRPCIPLFAWDHCEQFWPRESFLAACWCLCFFRLFRLVCFSSTGPAFLCCPVLRNHSRAELYVYVRQLFLCFFVLCLFVVVAYSIPKQFNYIFLLACLFGIT